MSQSQSLTLHVGLIAEGHDVVRELVGLQRLRVPPSTSKIFPIDKAAPRQIFLTGNWSQTRHGMDIRYFYDNLLNINIISLMTSRR